jgi:hypothetical protein
VIARAVRGGALELHYKCKGKQGQRNVPAVRRRGVSDRLSPTDGANGKIKDPSNRTTTS